MDRSTSDIVMKFTLAGQDVDAECLLEIDKDDAQSGLMKGFRHSADYRTSNFFEVSDFDFGLAVKEDEAVNQRHANLARLRTEQDQAIVGAFARWRSATRAEIKNIKYPVEFEKFSFSKGIDRASPIFFEKCCTSTTFDSAVLVRRMAQGQLGGVNRATVGYLRIEFGEVLITGLSWDDGDVVKEKCEFICKTMKVTYRSQSADGTIGSRGEQTVTWKNEAT